MILRAIVLLFAAAEVMSQSPLFQSIELEPMAASRPAMMISHIPEAKGGGVSVVDLDSDGILDIVACIPGRVDDVIAKRPTPPPRIWRGLGAMRFEEVKSASWPALSWPMGSIYDDLDGDGRRDVVWSTVNGLRCWRNLGDFRFADTTKEWMPDSAINAGWCTSATWADLDLDGDLDLVVARYLEFPWENPPRDGANGRVCRYKGHPTVCGPRGFTPMRPLALRRNTIGFKDATTEWRFDRCEAVYGLGIVALDVNRDGRPDIAVAADMTPNLLFVSDADGGFHEEGATAGIAFSADGAPQAGMGIDVGDLNQDGLDDLVITNFEGETNSILIQRTSGGFAEVSASCGTAPVDRPRLGWGVGIRDFDGDGCADILVANGHVYPDAKLVGSTFEMPMTLHLGGTNDSGKMRFRQARELPAIETPRVGRGLALGDFDADGRLDAVMSRIDGPPVILHNRAKERRWIGIRIRGGTSNLDGVGATLSIMGHSPTATARLRVDGSFLAQSEPSVIFVEPSYGFSPGQVMTVTVGKKSVTVSPEINRYTTVDIK